MNKQSKWFVLILILLTSNSLYAAQWYQIELIVFAQDSSNTEVFDQTQSSIQWPRRLIELSQTRYVKAQLLQTPVNYAKLQSADHLLNAEYNQLRARRRYRPLLHEAWVQSVAPNSKSRPVRIFQKGGVPGNFPVNGYVSLERGHYLHLSVNLEYDAGGQVYTLDQRRRLRLNELNYLDHPKFGVIATVNRHPPKVTPP